MSFKSVITDIASGQTVKSKLEDAGERFKQSLVAPLYNLPLIGSSLREINNKRQNSYSNTINTSTDRPAEETLEKILDADIKIRNELGGINKTLADIGQQFREQNDTLEELLDDAEKEEILGDENKTQSETSSINNKKLNGDATASTPEKEESILTRIEHLGEGFLGLEGIIDLIGTIGGAGLLGALGSATAAIGVFAAGVYGIKKLIDYEFPSLSSKPAYGGTDSTVSAKPDLVPVPIPPPLSSDPKRKGISPPWRGGPDTAPMDASKFITNEEDKNKTKTTFEEYDDVGERAIGFGHRLTPEEKRLGKITIGKKTIDVGIGRTKGHGKLTREEATELFETVDAPKYEGMAEVALGEKNWKLLNKNQKTAILDYVYNAGSEHDDLKKIKHILDTYGNNVDAIANVLESSNVIHAKGKVVKALVDRRKEEAALARTPEGSTIDHGGPEHSSAEEYLTIRDKTSDAEISPPKVASGKTLHDTSKEMAAADKVTIVPVPVGGGSGGGVVPVPSGGGSSPSVTTVALTSSSPPNSVDINNMG